jgi:hypothetical protein
MSRFARRTVIVMVGLILGWYAAGMVDFHPADPAHAADPAKAGAEDGGKDTGYRKDDGQRAAEALQPKAHDRAYYPTVLKIIIGLFAAAVVIGIIARAMGYQDPGVVATEEDQAEAHHDDHDDHH